MTVRYYFLTLLVCMSANIFSSMPAAAQNSSAHGGANIPNQKSKMKRLAQLSMTTDKLPTGEIIKRFKLTIPSKNEWCCQTVTITPAHGQSLDHTLVVNANDYDRHYKDGQDASKLHVKTMYNTGSGPLAKDCQPQRFLKRSTHLKIFAHQILGLQELPSSIYPKPDCYQLEDIQDAQKKYLMRKISLFITEAKGETYISDDEDEQQ